MCYNVIVRFNHMSKECTDCQIRIRNLRMETGMNRRVFCDTFDIPYQTVTDWELGHRSAPDYVVRLLEYYVRIRMMDIKRENDI